MPVLILERHGGKGHIVGADAHAQPGVQQLFRRVQRIGRLCFALDIARRADLQRDAVLNRTLPERGIVKNMVAMPDALCAELQRVPHGVRPLRVARVAREGQAQLPRQVENRVKISQRDDPLRARQVHPHNAGAEIFLRQPHGFKVFRHVGRLRADAHTAQQNAAAIVREGAQRLLPPGQHGLDGVLLGLIRQALKSGSAVVLIFSVFQSSAGGRVMENSYRPYGEYYNLPMISMGDSIISYFNEDGFYDWYFGDTLHPNNTGYQLMSDCIMNLMDTVDKADADTDNITDIDAMAPKQTAAYQGIKMIDAKTTAADDEAIASIDAGSFTETDSATGSFQYAYNGKKGAAWFPDNWMHDEEGGNNALTIKATCKTLMFVYKLSNSKTFGSADVYIDGVKKGTLSGYDSSGWNNGKVYVAMTEDKAAEHTIELKMKDGDEEKKFTFMAIGFN